jgi:hypothetical protein
MSNSSKNTKRAKNLETVLGLATGAAKDELGTADNKSVTAAATLNVSATEGDTTTSNGQNASVTLGVTATSQKKGE